MSSSSLRLGVAIALLLAVPACAGTLAPSVAPVPARATFLGSPELDDPLVKDELVLEAIQRLRPHFLLTRSSVSPEGVPPTVEVSLDGGAPRPLSTIADLRVRNIRSITLVPAAEAGPRFGLRDRFGPVLLIATR